MSTAALTMVLIFARTAIVDGTIFEKFQKLEHLVVDHHKGEATVRNGVYEIDKDDERRINWDKLDRKCCLSLFHMKGSSEYRLSTLDYDKQMDDSPYNVDLETFDEPQFESEYERQVALNRERVIQERGSVEKDTFMKFKQLERFHVDWLTEELNALNGVYEISVRESLCIEDHGYSQEERHSIEWRRKGQEKLLVLTYWADQMKVQLNLELKQFESELWTCESGDVSDDELVESWFHRQIQLDVPETAAVIEERVSRYNLEETRDKSYEGLMAERVTEWGGILGQTNKELADLRRQNQEMRRADKLMGDQMIEDRQVSQAHLTKEREKVAELERKVQEYKKEIKKLMSEKAIEECTELQTTFVSLREESGKNLAEMQRTWKKEKIQFEQKLESKQKGLNKLDTEYQRQKGELKDLRKTQGELQRRVTSISSDLQSKEEEVKSKSEEHLKVKREADQRISELETNTQELTMRSNALQMKVDELETKNVELVQQTEELQRENRRVDDLNGKLKKNEISLNEHIERVDSENEALAKRLEDTEATNKGLEKDIETSNARVLTLEKEVHDTRTGLATETERGKERESELTSEILQLQKDQKRVQNEILESRVRQITEREENVQYRELFSRERTQRDEDDDLQRLADAIEGAEALMAERADRESRQTEEREAFERELSQRQQEAVHLEEEHRQKESQNEYLITIALLIGGGLLTVVGFTVFVLARKSYNEMSDDMEYELNAQLRRVKEPHPLVPEYPSAHANRLGIHEHPAVRDVFGMKEPWDVTPGEGFHVSRITKGGRTPGTRGAGTDEGVDVRIEVFDNSEIDVDGVDAVEQDVKSCVSQNEGE